jgi:hypothetical protein
MRHIRALLGASLVLAALVVLLWPGSLVVLGLAALGIGILLLACVALVRGLARRCSLHRPDPHR